MTVGLLLSSICLLLTLALLNSWRTKQIDYVQAYAQALIERTMYMNISPYFVIEGYKCYNNKKNALLIHNNIHGKNRVAKYVIAT